MIKNLDCKDLYWRQFEGHLLINLSDGEGFADKCLYSISGGDILLNSEYYIVNFDTLM